MSENVYNFTLVSICTSLFFWKWWKELTMSNNRQDLQTILKACYKDLLTLASSPLHHPSFVLNRTFSAQRISLKIILAPQFIGEKLRNDEISCLRASYRYWPDNSRKYHRIAWKSTVCLPISTISSKYYFAALWYTEIYRIKIFLPFRGNE